VITNTLSKPLFDEMASAFKQRLWQANDDREKKYGRACYRKPDRIPGYAQSKYIGIKLANKCMLMAGIAYNLKKLIKYGGKMLQNAITAY
jgi:hypothetical protein